MKKLLCVILAVVLILLSCGTAVFADDTDDALIFIAGSGEAIPGQDVDIPITVPQNPGVSGVMICVSYDPAVLRLNSVTTGSEDFPGSFYTSGNDFVMNPFNITWTANTSLHANYVGVGLFATLHFTVLNSAALGQTAITLSYKQSSTFDVDFNDVHCAFTDGVVNVVPAWKFADSSTLRLWHGNTKTYVTGFNSDYPDITGNIETNGGWSYDVQVNSAGMETTGAVLQIKDDTGTVVESYEAVFFGDVNGDGDLSVSDAMDCLSIALDLPGFAWEDEGLEEPQQYALSMAADITHDGEVTVLDVVELIAVAINVEWINQLWMQDGDPAILYEMP